MPIDTSIELFNCSLCSYCDNNLDGLAGHIRKHIKPEPDNTVAKQAVNNDVDDNVVTHGNSEGLLNGLDSSVATSNIVTSSVGIKETNDTSHPLSPRIEVINPRTVSTVVNSADSIPTTDSQKQQQQCVSYKNNTFSPSQEKNQQLVYPRNVSSHQTILHSVQVENNPAVSSRYLPLQPRETEYMDINTPHHHFNSQYVANVSGKSGNALTDVPTYRSSENRMPKSIAASPYPSSPNRVANPDSRFRSSHSYDAPIHTAPNVNYQTRPIIPVDGTFRANTVSTHAAHPITPHTVKSQRNPHVVPPLTSPLNTPVSAYQKADERTKQYHNRLSGIQLADVQKLQSSPYSPMGVPNNGIFLNPAQLMLGNGSTSVDQLAGILVVPLKKTSDVGCQTDYVCISSDGDTTNKSSRGIQTDMLMGQLQETNTKSSTPLFGNFRVTDELFECLVCGDEFASDHHLQEHMSQYHTYVCDRCYHSSTNLGDHSMHIAECGLGEVANTCINCNSTFPSLKKLNQHRSKIHGIRMPFRCGVCSVPFETHEAVMKHISTHDTDVPEFKCRYCVKVFQSAEGLSKHFERHKGVDVLHECRFCKKSYSTNNLLRDHISYVHVIRDSRTGSAGSEHSFTIGSPGKSDKKSLEDQVVVSASKKYPLCRHCDLAFKNSELLLLHTENCSKNNDAKATPFVCDVCKEYYATDLQRKQHLKKEHRRESGFRCPKCSKIYRTWSRLKFHTKQQHVKKTCSYCHMTFTKEHVLRKHQEDQHGKPQGQPGDRVYTCSLCHTILNTLTDLMNHRKDVHPELGEVRTADRSSNATMLSYISKNNVGGNMGIDGSSDVNDDDPSKSYPMRGVVIKRSPSEEELQQTPQELRCGLCDLYFEDEKRLKNHKGLIHGERLFKCNMCSKSFQYSSQVVWHVRNHHKQDKSTKVSSKLWKSKNKKFGVPPPKSSKGKSKFAYICQFCGAKFSQEKLLKNHKGSAHKIKLFSCDICNFQCGHSTELIWHVRTCRAKFKRQYPDSDYPTRASKSAKLDDGDHSSSENDGYVCHVCDNAFTIFENYQSHMKTHPGEEIPFRSAPSPDDSKGDSSNELTPKLGKHLKQERVNSQKSSPSIMSPSKQHSSLAQVPFGLEELLNIEPEFDQGVGEYVCPVCQKTTKSMTGMKTHYGRVHGVWKEGTSHKNTAKPKPPEGLIWPCKNCSRQFGSLGSLRHHSSVIHGFSVNKEDVDVIRGVEIEVEQTPAPPVDTHDVTYSCPYCEVSFTKSKSIRVHAFKKHGTVLTDDEVNQWRNVPGAKPQDASGDLCTRFKCSKCKSKFRTTKAIRVHSLKRHNHLLTKKELQKTKIRVRVTETDIADDQVPDSVNKDSENNVYPCDFCGRVFTNHRAYFTHYRQAHRDSTQLKSPKKPSKNEILNYTPGICPNTGSDSSASNSELKVAQIKKEIGTPVGSAEAVVDKVDCPKCGQSFKQIKGLYTHLFAAHHVTKDKYHLLFPNGMPKLPKKMAKCPKCDRICVDHRAMRIHIFKAHGVLYKDMNKEDIALADATVDPSDIRSDNTRSVKPKDTVNGNAVGTAYNENELRVVEAEFGPPVCFICGRAFKSRRALMTHEYKYHGIRWEGNKRIFPQQVRNVPNLKSVSQQRSYPHPKATPMDLTISTADVDGFQSDSMQPSLYSGSNSADEDLNREMGSDIIGDTGASVKENNVQCPHCPSRFHNRRAITTHISRVHQFKKAKLKKYYTGATASKNDKNENENDDDDDTGNDGVQDAEEDGDVDENDEYLDISTNTATYTTDNGLYNRTLNSVTGLKTKAEVVLELNDAGGDCDTIKASDIEAYESIGKALEMNGHSESDDDEYGSTDIANGECADISKI